MPTYKITDPTTGRKISITADAPPTESELDDIFANLPQPTTSGPDVATQIAESPIVTGIAQMGGIAARGALALPAFATEALQQGWNLIAPDGMQISPEMMATEDLRRMTSRAGTSPGSEVAEAGIAALTPVGIAGQMAKAAPSVVAGAGKAMAAIPGTQVASAITGESAQEAAEAAGAGPVGQLVAGVAGAAAPFARASSVAKAAESAEGAISDAAPSTGALKTASSEIYDALEKSGVKIKQNAVGSLSSDISSMLKSEGYNAKLHPRIGAVLDEFDAASKGGDITVSNMETLRRVAQNAAKSLDASESRLGGMMLEKIDEFFEGIPAGAFTNSESAGQALKQARSLWSSARKSEMIQEAIEKAGMQASGLENGIRVQFRQILSNKKKMRGVTEEEKKAMLRVVNGTGFGNVLRQLGKFGFNEGQAGRMLLSTIGMGGGAAAGSAAGPVGSAIGAIAVPAIGQVAMKAAQNITKQNAQLADAITRAGKNGKQIAMAYMRAVPKEKRDVNELAGLLLKGDASTLEALSSSNDKEISRAATAAMIIGMQQTEGNQ